ncbi:MAG: hypothetical protein EOO27_32540, partial [Comamonadaceae bacterium]
MSPRVADRPHGLAAMLAGLLVTAMCVGARAAPLNPLTNPDAVTHQIDRSAMKVPLQGWSRDLRFPVYPIQVQRGSNGIYYTTSEHAEDYESFGFDALRCEIGDADRAVLKLPGYSCQDGVCTTSEGAILGTDPRRPAAA